MHFKGKPIFKEVDERHNYSEKASFKLFIAD